MGTTAEKLQAILDSKETIRQSIISKGGEAGETLLFADYGSAILEIPTGGGGTDISDANAAVGNVLDGKTFYAGTEPKKIGTMPNNYDSNYLIYNVADVLPIQEGYYDGSGIVAIESGEAASIVSENIKSGVTILGVSGSANVVDTFDANALVGDIISGKSGYVAGTKVTGTMLDRGTVSTSITTKAQEVSIAAGKHSGSGIVKIDTAEQAKIIAENIKKDVVLLGVTGTLESSGGGDTSMQNFIAVRNKTKTTLIPTDIDFSSFTGGVYSGTHLFSNCTSLTSVDLNFPNLTGNQSCNYMFNGCSSLISATVSLPVIVGTQCLISMFRGCTNLSTLRLNLPNLSGTWPFAGDFLNGVTAIATIIIDGLSNQAIWNSTSANDNLFRQTATVNCQNVTFNCDILPNFNIAYLTSLNLTSVVNILGKLFDYSSGTAHTITFNRAFTGLSQGDYDLINAAKITANNRNWTVAGLTYSL